MELDESHYLETVDYCIFGLVLLLSILIGLYSSWKGNKSPEEYLTGNRSFGAVPIGMSLLTTFVAAEGILGCSGEAYADGIQLSLFVVGVCCGILMAGILILPVLFPLQMTSIHEYVQLRFHSPCLRSCVTLLTCLQVLFYSGFCLAAPAIALDAITPLSSTTYICILGAVCTFYSTIGGMRAIVWTDVLQLCVIIFGLVTIIISGTVQVGGFDKILSISVAGGRLSTFNTDPRNYDRINIYNTITFGFFHYFSIYSVTQANYQRVISVPTIQDARKVFLINIVGMIFIYALTFAGGIIAYSAYAGCDPLLLGVIKRKEEILPFFVADRLKFITGLPGLFIATLTAGSLSTLSSIISAQVAMLWKEVSFRFKRLQEAPPSIAALINKCLSLVIGIKMVGFALLVANAGSIIRYSMSVLNVGNGAIVGIYCLGIFFPKCNLIGAWSGFAASLGMLSWIAVGGALHVKSPVHLPFSTALCNATLADNSTFHKDQYTNFSTLIHDADSSGINDAEFVDFSEENSHMMKLYSISFTLYPLMGISICFIVGVAVSYITANLQKIENISPVYLSPYVWYFFNKELKRDFREEQVKFLKRNLPTPPINVELKKI